MPGGRALLLGADVAALREELIVLEARKNGAAQMYARGTIDEEQLGTITAEAARRISAIRADLSEATARSPLADFAATDDARRTWRELTLGRRREVLRHLITVTLPPLGRGHAFSRNLIQIGPATPPGGSSRCHFSLDLARLGAAGLRRATCLRGCHRSWSLI